MGHDDYRLLDLTVWLGGSRPLIVDAHRVLSREQLGGAARAGCRVWAIGRGTVRQ